LGGEFYFSYNGNAIGSYSTDQGRNITGLISFSGIHGNAGVVGFANGVFRLEGLALENIAESYPYSGYYRQFSIDASRQWGTDRVGNQFQPASVSSCIVITY
jgi:hypothetical protein